MRSNKEAYISALKRVIESLQSRADAHYNNLQAVEVRATIDGIKEDKWITLQMNYCAWNDVLLFAQQHLIDIDQGRKEVK